MSCARSRGGFTLVETVAALALSALVLTLLIGICLAQLRLARAVAARTAAAETVRTAVSVLGGEARRMTSADVRAYAPESLAVRAFRGMAVVCGATGSGITVRHRGDRLPDPRKDSLLVLSPVGWMAAALLDSRSGADCAALPGEDLLEWRLDTLPAHATTMLVFESGSYYLSSRALRYRLGLEGRQPLTPEALRHPQSRFLLIDGNALHFSTATTDTQRVVHSVRFGSPAALP